jgi:arylsulfatase A-like enzyme
MAAGWAVGFDAPFGWMKQVPSDFGGTRNGMVVSWPKGIKAKNEIRSQFGHVIDVAPTILQAIGLPEPKVVNGTPQIPMEGTSLAYTFADGKAKERHTTQYFEIAGNRAIYHDGWFARTIHRRPGSPSRDARLQDRLGVGAVRHARGFQPGQRPRREESAEAGRTAGRVHAGSREIPRAADR